ncbi:MAG: MFS transporter permease [Microbacterium sp.]|uniref:MFS transporter permease n=1 Tax=Microbacterium sp. TaxID=51671 RepID=UPI0039E63AA9
MWIRRAFFAWLFPAAVVLPLWLYLAWIFSGAGGWAFLWVMFAAPAVFVLQLLLALVVRVRQDVREQRALAWADVAGFGLWHVLTIGLGFYAQPWWAAVWALAVVVGVGLCWFEGRRAWRRIRGGDVVQRTDEGVAYIPAPHPRTPPDAAHPVIVVEESR